MAIYFTSDLHLNHNKPFIYEARGFSSIHEHNEEIIKRWNSVINPEDDIYVLGDLVMGLGDEGYDCIKQLKGNIHLALGNHDTNKKVEVYQNIYNIVEIEVAYRLSYGKKFVYASHYPMITDNTSSPEYNFFGHTHQITPFFEDKYWMYNVGVDAHNCYPIPLEKIISDINEFKA